MEYVQEHNGRHGQLVGKLLRLSLYPSDEPGETEERGDTGPGQPGAGQWPCVSEPVREEGAPPREGTRSASRPTARCPAPDPERCAELISAVARGDREAFATLFEHYAPRVKGYLMRGGTQEPVAEELAQEAMVILWRRASSFEPTRGSLSSWVFTIARNLRVDHHRRSTARGAGRVVFMQVDFLDAEPGSADARPRPDEVLHAAQRERNVHRALAKLTTEQACLLQMSFFEERPQAAIAQVLGIPLGSVRARMRTALAHIRKHLEVG